MDRGFLAPGGRQPGQVYDLRWAWGVLCRNAWIVAVSAAAFMLIALIHILTATPYFRAEGEIVFDLREPTVISSNPILQRLGADTYAIDSQVEVVRSFSVASKVIKGLNLNEDTGLVVKKPWFLPVKLWFSDMLSNHLGIPNEKLTEAPVAKILTSDIPESLYNKFLQNLEVSRKGISFVIEVSYSDRDPERAALIVNAVMDAYIGEQRRVKVETVSAANSWLAARVNELRQKLVEAEKSVRQFKTEDSTIDAKVMGSLYESFLTRWKETQAQELLQNPDARIISAAVPPTKPSHPKPMVALGLALGCGLSMGAMLAFLRGWMDPVVYDVRDVERAVCAPILAVLPQLVSGRGTAAIGNGELSEDEARAHRIGSHVLENPDSEYSQGIFALKQAAEMAIPAGVSKLVAIISAHTGEGKTTTALNLARYAAASGVKTLFVDADLRSTRASNCMKPCERNPSLVDVSLHSTMLSEAVVEDPYSPLKLCPTADSRHCVPRPTDVIGCQTFTKVANVMRDEYEFVVFDTPAFVEYADARALLPRVDLVILIVELGRTTNVDLKAVMANSYGLRRKLLGVVVNKSKVSVL